MRIEATFITSAAGAADLPSDGRPEVALVGRSNVGKSSLINALVRRKVARTSAAPGKTRLANVYRVARGDDQSFYLVDLPGYGYARGGDTSARAFDELTRAFFGQEGQEGRVRQDRQEGKHLPAHSAHPARPVSPAQISALLLVDSRHPGLQKDIEAWRWLQTAAQRCAVVATKIDKLTRGERIRALRQCESVFEHPVLPVSAVTGEGLDELWTLINRLANNPNSPRRRETGRSSPQRPPRATAARPPKK